MRRFDLIRWNLLGEKKDYVWEAFDNMFLRPEDPPYNFVPYEIFWRRGADYESIEILNPDYRYPRGTTIAGWSRSAWLPGASAANINTQRNNTLNVMMGYRSDWNNYLDRKSVV